MFNWFKKNKNKPQRKIFKYNEDDILEILTEYLADINGYTTFNSKAILLGEPGKDLRLIAVIDENNSDLTTINFSEIDRNMDYNGYHNFIENNPQYDLSHVDYDELLKKLKK